MIMILFGALSAGIKTYLLCRSDRHAFMSTFCNTLPVGYLKFCFSLEIRSSIWLFTISFQDDRTESSTISRLFFLFKTIYLFNFFQLTYSLYILSLFVHFHFFYLHHHFTITPHAPHNYKTYIQHKMLAQEIWNHLYALKQLRRSKI